MLLMPYLDSVQAILDWITSFPRTAEQLPYIFL
jgi:hypothetical protein